MQQLQTENNGVTAIEKSSRRMVFLDLARVIAVLCVVMIHVSGGYMSVYPNNSVEYVFANIFDSFSRLGVPLFVMVSGALFLDEKKEITLKYIAKKILSIVILFYLWSAFYALVNDVVIALIQGGGIDPKALLLNFIMGHYHMWFLFMIIGLYLITPFLRCFVKKENTKLVIYFLIIALVVQALPILLSDFTVYFDGLNLIEQLLNNFYLDFFCGYTALYIAGWYVAHVGFGKLQRRVLYIASFCALIAIFLVKQFVANSDPYNNLGLLSNFYCLGVFTLLSRREEWLNQGKKRKAVISLSNLSFGVYIIHIFILLLVRKVLNFISISAINMIVVWLCTCIVSFASVWVLSKIPFVKKAVRG